MLYTGSSLSHWKTSQNMRPVIANRYTHVAYTTRRTTTSCCRLYNKTTATTVIIIPKDAMATLVTSEAIPTSMNGNITIPAETKVSPISKKTIATRSVDVNADLVVMFGTPLLHYLND